MSAPDWTIYLSPEAREAAKACARGSYQAALLSDCEAWSGSTLKGRAKHWGGQYARSRRALVARLRSAGLACEWRRGPHGRRMLAIG